MADIQLHNFPAGTALFADTVIPTESGSTTVAYETQKFTLEQLIDNTTITQNGSFKYQVETAAIVDGTTIQETSNAAHVVTDALLDGTTLSASSNVASVLTSGIVDGTTTTEVSNKVVANMLPSFGVPATWTTWISGGGTFNFGTGHTVAILRVMNMAVISGRLIFTTSGTFTDLSTISLQVPSIIPNPLAVGDVTGTFGSYTSATGVTQPFLNFITTENGTNRILFQTNQQLAGGFSYLIDFVLFAKIN